MQNNKEFFPRQTVGRADLPQLAHVPPAAHIRHSLEQEPSGQLTTGIIRLPTGEDDADREQPA